MRVAIIGSGYIGTAAAKYWKRFGHTIYATTRSASRLLELEQIVDKAILLQGEGPNRFDPLLKTPLDVILIAVAPSSHEDYRATYLQTVFDLSRLIHMPGRLQILYTSSTSVYGEYAGETVTEESPLNPLNSSTHVLQLTENALLNYSGPEKKVAIFRLGEIYGPGRRLTERLKTMQGKLLPGTGENITNLVHREDVVTALDLGMMGRLHGIYNLCNDLHLTRRELYERLCLQAGLEEPQWDPTHTAVHGGNKLVSNRRLKALGWEPKHQSLAEM